MVFSKWISNLVMVNKIEKDIDKKNRPLQSQWPVDTCTNYSLQCQRNVDF